MTTSFCNFVPHSRFNLSESASDIHFLVREYRERINKALNEVTGKSPFVSFAEKKLSIVDLKWLEDNTERFFKNTTNESVTTLTYLSDCGFITCMVYSENGEDIVVGHSTGLIQVPKSLNHVIIIIISHLLADRYIRSACFGDPQKNFSQAAATFPKSYLPYLPSYTAYRAG